MSEGSSCRRGILGCEHAAHHGAVVFLFRQHGGGVSVSGWEGLKGEGVEERFWRSVDGMVQKIRVSRESPAIGPRIALNIIAAAMTRVQLTHKHTSGMSIEFER